MLKVKIITMYYKCYNNEVKDIKTITMGGDKCIYIVIKFPCCTINYILFEGILIS